MLEKRNDCLGCETCRNCGNDKPYYVHLCDSCGSEPDAFFSALYAYNGKEYCPECLIEHLIADGVIEEVPQEEER